MESKHYKILFTSVAAILFFCLVYIALLQTKVTPPQQTATIYNAHKRSTKTHAPLVMIGIPDTELSKKTADMIRAYNIGGILLLSRNIQSEEQLRKLTEDIHALNPKIIIAIDEEGGPVSRIEFPHEKQPAQKDIQTELDAYIIAHKRASLLKRYGIDMNLSPVADFITDERSFLFDRTFQSDPETIALLAGGMIRGYEDGGVIPVLKHFPGHTDASVDTHENIAHITLPQEILQQHMEPFKKIIDRFSPPAIMVSGGIYTAYDTLPAALSPVLINNVLKNTLGFTGLVISDDLEMKAFTQYSLAKRAELALKAGCHIIIISRIQTTDEELEATLLALKSLL